MQSEPDTWQRLVPFFRLGRTNELWETGRGCYAHVTDEETEV